MAIARVALTLGLLALAGTAHAASSEQPEEPAQEAGPLLHPAGPGRLRWRAGFGTLVDLFPLRIVSAERHDSPELTVAARLGLPADVSVDLRARTQLVANQAAIGLAWSHRFGVVTAGLLDHQGAAYGTFENADTTARTWCLVNEPGVAAGISVDRVHLSLTAEMIAVFAQHTKAETGAQLARGGVRIGGTTLTFVAEHTFAWGLLYVGAAWVRAPADYLSWVPYSVPDAHINYLRLVAGYAY